MRFSLVNVWYMKIFLLLLTYGNMNFKLRRQAKDLKGSLFVYIYYKNVKSKSAIK
ncbi:hypothetical protein LINPERPRIM_LOCUS44873 [Linum perenne]